MMGFSDLLLLLLTLPRQVEWQSSHSCGVSLNNSEHFSIFWRHLWQETSSFIFKHLAVLFATDCRRTTVFDDLFFDPAFRCLSKGFLIHDRMPLQMIWSFAWHFFVAETFLIIIWKVLEFTHFNGAPFFD